MGIKTLGPRFRERLLGALGLAGCEPPQRSSDAPATEKPARPEGARQAGLRSGSSGWIWQNPEPQGNMLLAVWPLGFRDAYAAGAAGTLLKLEDEGRQGTFLDTPNFYGAFRDLAFVIPTEGWALSGSTAFHTADAGLTWTDQHVPSGSPQLLQIKAVDPLHLFISARKGYFFRTADGGTTWSLETYDNNPGIDCAGLDFTDASYGWQGCTDGILATVDGGKTWRLASADANVRNALRLDFVDRSNGWAANNRLVARTRDGGRTWTPTAVGSGNFWGLYVVRDRENGYAGWAVGDRGEIFATRDGDRWVPQVSGTTHTLRAVRFLDDLRTGWAVGDAGTILITVDGGATWVARKQGAVPSPPRATPLLASVAFTADEKTGYAVGQGGLILKTTDSGEGWAPVSGPTPGPDLTGVAVHPTRPEKAWAVGDSGTGLWTDDGGATWHSSTVGPATSVIRAVHFLDENRGIAVGQLSATVGAFWSTADGGKRWSQIVNPFLRPSPLYAVHLNAKGGGAAVGLKGDTFWTGNGGRSWNLPRGRPSGENLRGVYMRADGTGWTVGEHGTILAATDSGLYWSVVQTGKLYDLNAVWGQEDRDEALAVGTQAPTEVWFGSTMGTILELDGSAWKIRRSRTHRSLWGVRAFGTGHAWVVGDEASILRTSNGGED
jgi:photosystem II stability/assembly factor-like uncharacterized protein